MKTTMIILPAIILLLLLADTTIQFKPFKISFANLTGMFGFIIFMLGVFLMTYNGEKKAYKQGYTKGVEDAREAITEVLNESKSNQ